MIYFNAGFSNFVEKAGVINTQVERLAGMVKTIVSKSALIFLTMTTTIKYPRDDMLLLLCEDLRIIM